MDSETKACPDCAVYEDMDEDCDTCLGTGRAPLLESDLEEQGQQTLGLVMEEEQIHDTDPPASSRPRATRVRTRGAGETTRRPEPGGLR